VLKKSIYLVLLVLLGSFSIAQDIQIDMGDSQLGSYGTPSNPSYIVTINSTEQQIDGTPATKFQLSSVYAFSNMAFAPVDISEGNSFDIDIYGDASGSWIRLELYSSAYTAYIYKDITIDFSGWQSFSLKLDGTDDGMLDWPVGTRSNVLSSVDIWHISGSWNSIAATVYVDNAVIKIEDPIKAIAPDPSDGSFVTDPNLNISWMPSGPVDGYNVFFGTNFNSVNDAQAVCIEGDIVCDGTVDLLDLHALAQGWISNYNNNDFAALSQNWQQQSVFKGYRAANTYDPGQLQLGQDYYWRIDQVADPNVYKGDVWSFKVINPLENQMFPKGSGPADVIDIVSITYETSDTKLAAITLQGQINKGAQSKVFLTMAAWDSFWLTKLYHAGHAPSVNSLTLAEYFQKYSDVYDKVVVYDPDLDATINVATAIASLENAIVIHPDHISTYGASKTVQDLRGLWTTNVDAYQWAFANLWPSMNQDIIACYHPTELSHHIRDYLIRHKVFPFWVTNASYDAPPKSDYWAERGFFIQLLEASPPNTPIIGFYYAGATTPGIGEAEGVRLSTAYGKLMTAAAWPSNMSLISGNVVDWESVLNQYHNRGVAPTPEFDPDKVYICFNIVDSGDAPGYWMYQEFNVWADSNRGNIPINWSLGPGTVELLPGIMEYYYTQATPNDSFYMGLSGAGYVFPYTNFMSLTANPDAAWNEYLALTDYYAALLGIKEISLYTNLAWACFNPSVQNPITQRFVDGLDNIDTFILGMGRDDCVYPNFNYKMGTDTLVSHITTRWDKFNIGRSAANNLWLANEIRNNTPAARPNFMHVMAISWSYYPSDLVDVLNELGSDYVAVSASDLKKLYDQANGP
jgi:hypothetical protein